MNAAWRAAVRRLHTFANGGFPYTNAGEPSVRDDLKTVLPLVRPQDEKKRAK
jgi:hypothetical protein